MTAVSPEKTSNVVSSDAWVVESYLRPLLARLALFSRQAKRELRGPPRSVSTLRDSKNRQQTLSDRLLLLLNRLLSDGEKYSKLLSESELRVKALKKDGGNDRLRRAEQLGNMLGIRNAEMGQMLMTGNTEKRSGGVSETDALFAENIQLCETLEKKEEMVEELELGLGLGRKSILSNDALSLRVKRVHSALKFLEATEERIETVVSSSASDNLTLNSENPSSSSTERLLAGLSASAGRLEAGRSELEELEAELVREKNAKADKLVEGQKEAVLEVKKGLALKEAVRGEKDRLEMRVGVACNLERGSNLKG